MKAKFKRKLHPLVIVLTLVFSLAAAVFAYGFLGWGLLNVGVPGSTAQSEAMDLAVMDAYDMRMTNTISNALDGVLAIEKVYWLNDDDMIAPEPNPEGFGTATDPASLQWLLDEAAELLDIEEFMFTTETVIRPGT